MEYPISGPIQGRKKEKRVYVLRDLCYDVEEIEEMSCLIFVKLVTSRNPAPVLRELAICER